LPYVDSTTIVPTAGGGSGPTSNGWTRRPRSPEKPALHPSISMWA